MKIIILLFAFVQFAMPCSESAIVGKWRTSKGDGIISIYNHNDAYYGRIVWFKKSDNPEKNIEFDKHNPDPKLRNRSIKEIDILSSFKWDGGDTWDNGYVYDARSGDTYNSYIRCIDDSTIVLRGYILLPIFGKSDKWTKVK